MSNKNILSSLDHYSNPGPPDILSYSNSEIIKFRVSQNNTDVAARFQIKCETYNNINPIT